MLWLEQNLCLSSASIQRKKTNWLTPIAHSSNPSLVFHPQTSQLMSQRKFCVRESIPGLVSSAGKEKCIHGIISAKKNPDVLIKKKKEDAAKKPMSDWIAIDTAMLCLLMTSELTLPFKEGTSLQQNRQLESNKGKSSIRSFVKNTTTVKSTMNMHIDTSWRHAKR